MSGRMNILNEQLNDLESDMSNDNNSATVYFPSHLHWTSEQLADAVPLRLHQLFAFNAGHARDSANACVPTRQMKPRRYLPDSPAPDVFRIR